MAQKVERRLAAILSADVVGYSRLNAAGLANIPESETAWIVGSGTKIEF
jgi:hypothetical protein